MQRYNCSCSGLDIDFLTVIICENRNLIEVISMLRSWRYLVLLLAAGAVVLTGLMFSVGPAQIYDPELGVVFAAFDTCGRDHSRGSGDRDCAVCLLRDGFCGGKYVRSAGSPQLRIAGITWRVVPVSCWSTDDERPEVRGPPCFEGGKIVLLRCETAGPFKKIFK